MITSNADQIAKELQQYADSIERKLKAMVAGFAGEIAIAASSQTKVVDPTLIEGALNSLYSKRKIDHKIEMQPGYHAGAWRYVEGELALDPTIYTNNQVQQNVTSDAKANYNLGDSFKVELKGPGVHVAGPTGAEVEPLITAAYKANIKRYFDQG